eukprot:GHUV01026731.1.p2 GENE.GHUV01026731.1~~GHUV01026731.1.p2  ORF type:complete len:127 (+),score=22.20 GHUV01026731.1:509-889(+)
MSVLQRGKSSQDTACRAMMPTLADTWAGFPAAVPFAMLLWCLVLLAGPTAAGCCMYARQVDAKSSKYACEFSNRLCQWQARYAFGAAVIGDMVSAHIPSSPCLQPGLTRSLSISSRIHLPRLLALT